jgi:hypothetical protein
VILLRVITKASEHGTSVVSRRPPPVFLISSFVEAAFDRG